MTRQAEWTTGCIVLTESHVARGEPYAASAAA
jgi:hypothetical protein